MALDLGSIFNPDQDFSLWYARAKTDLLESLRRLGYTSPIEGEGGAFSQAEGGNGLVQRLQEDTGVNRERLAYNRQQDLSRQADNYGARGLLGNMHFGALGGGYSGARADLTRQHQTRLDDLESTFNRGMNDLPAQAGYLRTQFNQGIGEQHAERERAKALLAVRDI